jgi:hypothetical protein
MSQELNNFEQLLEEEALKFDFQKHQQAKESIINTLGSYKLLGQLVTVFLPDMFNVLVAATKNDHTPIDTHPRPSKRKGQPPHLGHDPTDDGPQFPDGEAPLIR